jgi:hypothetical protein
VLPLLLGTFFSPAGGAAAKECALVWHLFSPAGGSRPSRGRRWPWLQKKVQGGERKVPHGALETGCVQSVERISLEEHGEIQPRAAHFRGTLFLGVRTRVAPSSLLHHLLPSACISSARHRMGRVSRR